MRPRFNSPGLVVSLHISVFEGGQALRDFRIQQLLPRLAAISPHIQGLSARYVHLVASESALSAEQQKTDRKSTRLNSSH